jgi:hypothetical protein
MADLPGLVNQLGNLTVLEAAELSKMLRERLEGPPKRKHLSFNEGKVCDAIVRRLEEREQQVRANLRWPGRKITSTLSSWSLIWAVNFMRLSIPASSRSMATYAWRRRPRSFSHLSRTHYKMRSERTLYSNSTCRSIRLMGASRLNF